MGLHPTLILCGSEYLQNKLIKQHDDVCLILMTFISSNWHEQIIDSVICYKMNVDYVLYHAQWISFPLSRCVEDGHKQLFYVTPHHVYLVSFTW